MESEERLSKETIDSFSAAVSDIELFVQSIDIKSTVPSIDLSGSHVFDTIKEEYEFFLGHSTESKVALDNMIASITPHIHYNQGEFDFLDFGCGDGKFTQELLSALPIRSAKNHNYLVEPNTEYLSEAGNRVACFSKSQIIPSGDLNDIQDSTIDIGIANHSVYYLSDLRAFLVELQRVMKPGSLFLVTLANRENEITHINHDLYAINRVVFPKFIAEDFAHVLESSSIYFRSKKLESELCFVDSTENRLKTIKFLTAINHGKLTNISGMLRIFDSYKYSSKIRIQLNDTLFVLRF